MFRTKGDLHTKRSDLEIMLAFGECETSEVGLNDIERERERQRERERARARERGCNVCMLVSFEKERPKD